MPRRTSTRSVTSSATPQAPAVPIQPETPYDSNIRHLRRHWKWAAFSQFFFTFNPLLAMTDVTLTDVENDLVHFTNRVLSRVMQRLLITLTQDRKITTESWQNTLRRQYLRRDPDASPIGLPSRSHYFIVESSRASTVPPGTLPEASSHVPEHEDDPLLLNQSATAHSSDGVAPPEALAENTEHISTTKVEEEDAYSETLEAEKQVDWLDLSMLSKLDSLHTLAEWQFHNPNRVRQQMKTDDEQATWRIEPIGYDAKRNAYWLIGGDRLWIQREPPRSNLKRKRKPGVASRRTAKEQSRFLTVKRQRTDSISLAVGQTARSTRNKVHSQSSPGSREGRAAKTRANQRLDAQAKDLAEFRRQLTSSRPKTALATPHKSVGVRVSARLRGTKVDEDEWQEIPDEWLAKNETSHKGYPEEGSSGPVPSGKKQMKTGLESDESSVSELTELSDVEGDMMEAEQELVEMPVIDVEEINAMPAEKDAETEAQGQQDTEENSADPAATPQNFVEWETICVTLEDWESIGQRFEKATHYAEKALHKVLSQSIVPTVTGELKEIERKRRMEEAVVHRKRSSRIAMKEFEKEEERAAMRKRAEEKEKMSRAQRLEARQQKEQAERLRRENVREQRRKERELQEQQMAETHEAEPKSDAVVDDAQEGVSLKWLLGEQTKAPVTLSVVSVNNTGNGTRSPAENWELECEICGRKGINEDDGVPLMCCGVCGKWQHIVCHDKHDTMSGRSKRNWDTEDFICRRCHVITSKSASSASSASFMSHGVNGNGGQAQAYHGQAPNRLGNHPNNDYYLKSPPNARYPDHPDIQPIAPSPASYSYPSQPPSAGVTFAHYQPQQGRFSTSRPTYSVQDVNVPLRGQFTAATHATPATGVASYPSAAFHAQAVTHSTPHVQEQWPPYPRTTSSYPINGGSPVRAQGAQPYYNGHAHTSYAHMRETTSPTVLRQYVGLQHIPSYQHNK